MKLGALHQLLGEEVIFRSSALMAGQRSAANLRSQLARWVRDGKLVALRRGVYMLKDIPANRAPHPFVLANEMRRASYVSLQSALAYYGMIPEFVPAVTSVTTCRPEELDVLSRRFIFRHVKRDFFWGVQHVEIAPGQWVRLATREKALLDLIYLTPGADDPHFMDELRLEPVAELDMALLRKGAERSGSKKIARAISLLEKKWARQDKELVL
jgi:predicted transcriptional regulator of viral defense system